MKERITTLQFPDPVKINNQFIQPAIYRNLYNHWSSYLKEKRKLKIEQKKEILAAIKDFYWIANELINSLNLEAKNKQLCQNQKIGTSLTDALGTTHFQYEKLSICLAAIDSEHHYNQKILADLKLDTSSIPVIHGTLEKSRRIIRVNKSLIVRCGRMAGIHILPFAAGASLGSLATWVAVKKVGMASSPAIALFVGISSIMGLLINKYYGSTIAEKYSHAFDNLFQFILSASNSFYDHISYLNHITKMVSNSIKYIQKYLEIIPPEQKLEIATEIVKIIIQQSFDHTLAFNKFPEKTHLSLSNILKGGFSTSLLMFGVSMVLASAKKGENISNQNTEYLMQSSMVDGLDGTITQFCVNADSEIKEILDTPTTQEEYSNVTEFSRYVSELNITDIIPSDILKKIPTLESTNTPELKARL